VEKRFNYDKLRSELDDKELIEYLYHHYYYKLESISNKQESNIDKDELDSYFVQIITEYVLNKEHKGKIYKYLDGHIRYFCENYDTLEKRKKKIESLSKAFNGDNNARCKIFEPYIARIDEKANEIYDKYCKAGKCDVLISLDDIKQMMYLRIWDIFNSFYDNNSIDSYFSIRFSTQINRISDYIVKYIDELTSIEFADINNVSYSDSSFVHSIENSDVLDVISLKIGDKYKQVLNYVRQGYTYEQAGAMLGLTRQGANVMNEKIKELVIRTNIKW